LNQLHSWSNRSLKTFEKKTFFTREKRVLAKVEKRGRYKYSGLLDQEKYNNKLQSRQPRPNFC
jgi:predicted transcriptional regulator